ncbi:ammonium transporter [Paenibacillus sp. Marseille-Q4541]|uniref:ammonium transporter n=1 Tax=Paenibacillus sp. Marseille-Q4541 TaxID=2831522 RepID=UPI0032D59851
MIKRWVFIFCSIFVLLPLSSAYASDNFTQDQLSRGLNSVFVFVAIVLVFMMQAGFVLLEAGSSRMRNAGHIAGKTILTIGITIFSFWAIGFGVGFGNGNEFFGTTGFFLGSDTQDTSFRSLNYSDVPLALKFMFHLSFASVSLSIACGGMAERAKLHVYVLFGLLYVMFVYPMVAHWVWGGGWLTKLGMQDFAGSTVIHLTGATAALVATYLLKPRLGKYTDYGNASLMPGHNQVFTVVGVIFLWIGWFGFNPGSMMTPLEDGLLGYVALTTQISASGGVLASFIVTWILLGKVEIKSILNGLLAALVAISGSCAFVEVWAAFLIGTVAGVITFFATIKLEQAGLDDPMSAFSVHGIAGMWGAISTGLFAAPAQVERIGIGERGLFYGGGILQLGIQLLGLLGIFGFVLIISFAVLGSIKALTGIRVTEQEEITGLDVSEHGTYGYPEQMKS